MRGISKEIFFNHINNLFNGKEKPRESETLAEAQLKLKGVEAELQALSACQFVEDQPEVVEQDGTLIQPKAKLLRVVYPKKNEAKVVTLLTPLFPQLSNMVSFAGRRPQYFVEVFAETNIY